MLLTKIIKFLDLYFNRIELQEIYIRHITAEDARKNLREKEARDNLYKLQLLGWTFVTPTHLQRFGCQPLPEMPFLLTFIDTNQRPTAKDMFSEHIHKN